MFAMAHSKSVETALVAWVFVAITIFLSPLLMTVAGQHISTRIKGRVLCGSE